MPAVFISHSSRDGAAAEKIKTVLFDWGFERTFLDFDKDSGIGAGEDWEKRLYTELTRCHAVILLLTPNWVESKWCFAEFAQARALGKVILPLICTPLGEAIVLPGVQAIDFVDWQSDGLDRLSHTLCAITEDLARGFTLSPHRPPYPGINSFEEEDAAIFFGRDEETRIVIERLDARRAQGGTRFVVLIGASGAGKSSLIKAGVLPQLARRRNQWLVFPTMRPEKAPLETFAKILSEIPNRPRAWREWHYLLSCADGAAEVGELAKDLRIGASRAATLLFPIDQVEELFTIADSDERSAFLSLIARLLDPRLDLPIIVIATGRADVLQGLLETSELAHLTETIQLAPMPLDRVPQLVEGPAAVCALGVERGLAERIKCDVERPEALPLLAYTLRLLHQRCLQDKRLTLSAYAELGDPQSGLSPVQNSVRLAADSAIAVTSPSDAELLALRDAFVPHLVRLRLEDGARVRQVASMASLPLDADRLIRALTTARLLIMRTENGEPVVEVAHESLFAAWPTLVTWLDEEQAFLIDVERIKHSFEAWSKTPEKHRSEALLTGLLLANACDWLLTHPQRFVAVEMEKLRIFIDESALADKIARNRSQTLRRRLFQATVVASFIFLAASLITGWQYFRAENARKIAAEEEMIAKDQRDRAKKSLTTAQLNESRFLTSMAETESHNGNFERAGLIARLALPTDMRNPDRPLWAPAVSILSKVHSLDRVVAVLEGHTSSVWAAVWSSDATQVLTVSSDKTARIWDSKTGALRTVLPVQPAAVVAGSWSPDGERFVTASGKNARIWETTNGRSITILDGHTDVIWSAAWSPDGKRIATASSDKSVRIWDSTTGAQLAILVGHTDVVWSVAWSPDGNQVATGSADKTIRIWDARSGVPSAELTQHTGAVHSVAWSPDGTKIVSASDDNTARIWDAVDHNQISVLSGHKGAVIEAVWSPHGARIATASQDNTARIWDAKTEATIAVLEGHSNSVRSVAWSSDGTRLVTASWDKTARIWNAKTSEDIESLTGHTDWVYSAVWSPDGTRVATASEDKTARVWDFNMRAELMTLSGHTDRVRSAKWNPDGTRIVTASWDKTARIWDANSGAELSQLKGHTRGLNDAAWSPDGKRIVTASLDGTAKIWDVETNNLLLDLVGHTDAVMSAAWNPDGTLVVTASGDKTARIWDAKTGMQLKELIGHTDTVNSAAWSPNGNQILTAARDDTARVWDANSGTQLEVLEGPSDHIWSASWSPDGVRILTCSGENVAQIWDAQTGATIRVLAGHANGVWSGEYSPNGQLIATASRDNTVRFWQAWPLLTADTVEYMSLVAVRSLRTDELASLFMEAPSVISTATAGFNVHGENVAAMTIAQLQAAADAGDPFAHRRLAELYELGEQVGEDIETAVYHHAVEARLFEISGQESEAATARARRGSDARAISIQAATEAAYKALDWRQTPKSVLSTNTKQP